MYDLLDGLNPEQVDAVITDKQHVLILAGAGSGKTKTITSRVMHLLKNEQVLPQKILALTFTNKAAGEMRSRVEKSIGETPGLLIKTFHSFGALFLRKFPEGSGRKQNFIIYDDDDSTKVLNRILSEEDIPKSDHNIVKSWVRRYKQNLEKEVTDTSDEFIEIYNKYNAELKLNNAFDFEDLILFPVKILAMKTQVYEYYRRKFEHILVDEYQDTNYSQYMLLKLLKNDNANLMVVGDEDQSIYKFRGADVNIILNFPKDYSDTQIIRLEKNYRSTENILNVANSIISNNINRLGKTLVSVIGAGEKVIVIENENDYKEGETVAFLIRKNGFDYGDTAVLVRTNNQTRIIEQSFRHAGIPYIIVSGVGFYDREEIKDALAILRWISNNADRIGFERFVNKPSRGIGKKSLDIFFASVAMQFGGDILKALDNVDNIKGINGKAAAGLKFVRDVFEEIDFLVKYNSPDFVLGHFLDKLGLIEYYRNIDNVEGSERIDNLREMVASLENVAPGVENLTAYLEDNALISQSDKIDDENTVKVMTVHNAKGLEFKNVFITGVERDIFPHSNSVNEDPDGMEEERRLFYVAITRAKERLFLLYANARSIYGVYRGTGKSEFIDEIPPHLIELINIKKNVTGKMIQLELGDMVKHKDYGRGKVLNLRISGKYHLALIDFYDHSCAEVVLELTKLEKIDD